MQLTAHYKSCSATITVLKAFVTLRFAAPQSKAPSPDLPRSQALLIQMLPPETLKSNSFKVLLMQPYNHLNKSERMYPFPFAKGMGYILPKRSHDLIILDSAMVALFVPVTSQSSVMLTTK